MIETLYLVIPKSQWITANLRLHPMARAKRVRALRKRTAIEARKDKDAIFSFDGKVRITAKIYARSARRFDPNNAADTTKAMVDGLRDAGVLVDDDHTHVIGPDHRWAGVDRDLPVGAHAVELIITEAGSDD
nr:MAG TPA: Endodeoxyribonuclease RusA [Caudoviricetes sp.]